MNNNVILARNILYRCFFIGLAGYIFTIIVWLGLHNWIVNLSGSLYGMTKHDMSSLMLYFLSWMKLLLMYLFLIPALALHWTANSLKNQNK